MELGAFLDLAIKGRRRYKESCLAQLIEVPEVFGKLGGELGVNPSDLLFAQSRLKL